MEHVKRFFYSKKSTAGLGIIAIALGIGLVAFFLFQQRNCYPVYDLTYVPPVYDLSQVKFNKVAQSARNCSTEAVRFINGDSFEWSLEEREKETGLKTYRFDTRHMNFVEMNGRRYTFVSDRNGNPALLGFIENTFVYITNTQEPKLSKEDMVRMFDTLRKK